jgi:hypothetical protein
MEFFSRKLSESWLSLVERLTANAKVATCLGPILAFSDIVEVEE